MKLPIGIDYDGKRYTEVEIAPLTGKLLKLIRDSSGDNGLDAKAYMDVLKHGIASVSEWTGAVPTSLLNRMYWADAEYVFMKIAQSETDGDDAAILRRCPNCGANVRIPIDFDAIEVVDLDNSPDSAFANDDRTIPFSLRTPITTLDVDRTPYQKGKIGLLTVDDWLRILPQRKAKIGVISMMSILAAIYEIGPTSKYGDKQLSMMDLEHFSARDIKAIEKLYNKNVPGIQPFEPQQCDQCNAQIPIYIDWVQDFLAFSSD